ncbi:ankyrin repeat protein [Equine parapoxvirus]|nr:ankyrin repeat protein [Equine parapoxvirus]
MACPAFAAAALFRYLEGNAAATPQGVRDALAFGGEVNYRGTYNNTPLHAYMYARGGKDWEVLRLLLDAGADLNARDICGFTPLHVYLCYSTVELPLLRRLLERGARADATGRGGMQTDALFAYLNTHSVDGLADPEVVRALLDAGASVRARGDRARTPLHVYVGGFVVREEIVQLLLAAGADPRARTDTGLTPLDSLVRSAGASAGATRLLLAAGASATSRDERWKTALHHHADSFRASAEVVRALLEAGADPEARDAQGNTPLHGMATFCSCRQSVVQQLVDAGADVNAENAHGLTPMHYAAVYNPEACARLIRAGADPVAKSPDGRTPLGGMLVRGHVRSVRACLETSPPAAAVAAALAEARPGAVRAPAASAAEAAAECVAYVVLMGREGALPASLRAAHARLIETCRSEVALMARTRLSPEASLLDAVRGRAPPSTLLPARALAALESVTAYRRVAGRRVAEIRHKTRLVRAAAALVGPCALPPELVAQVLARVPADSLRRTLGRDK